MNKFNMENFIEECESMIITDYDIVNEGYMLTSILAISFSAIGLSKAGSYLKRYKKKGQAIEKIKNEFVDDTAITNTKELSPEDIKKIFSQVYVDVRKIVSKLKSDKKFMDNCDKVVKDLRDELESSGYSYINNYKYTLDAKIFEQSSKEIIILVIDSEQDITSELSFITSDIAQALEIKYPMLKISNGDGDEGCVYATIK